MAESWDKIQRQVILRANQLQADTASSLSTAYSIPAIGQTEMSDRAIEFPKVAIDDAILNACDKLVSIIGLDVTSPYRKYLAGVTSNISSGSAIPIVSSGNKSVIGVLGDIRDSTSSIKLKFREYQEVIGVPNMTLKQQVYWYFSDNNRIWHTRTNVVADVVIWDKSDQLTAMAAGTRGNCPFPQDLHEAIVCGALAYIFRGTFNIEQVGVWRGVFDSKLAELGAHIQSNEVKVRSVNE